MGQAFEWSLVHWTGRLGVGPLFSPGKVALPAWGACLPVFDPYSCPSVSAQLAL